MDSTITWRNFRGAGQTFTAFSPKRAYSGRTGEQDMPRIADNQRRLNMLIYNGFSQICEKLRNAEMPLGHTLTLPV
jgi:hypothetical protein